MDGGNSWFDRHSSEMMMAVPTQMTRLLCMWRLGVVFRFVADLEGQILNSPVVVDVCQNQPDLPAAVNCFLKFPGEHY